MFVQLGSAVCIPCHSPHFLPSHDVIVGMWLKTQFAVMAPREALGSKLEKGATSVQWCALLQLIS
jgi:hypothetical protein